MERMRQHPPHPKHKQNGGLPMSTDIYQLVEKYSKLPKPYLKFNIIVNEDYEPEEIDLSDASLHGCCWPNWRGIPKTEDHKKAIAIANSKPKTGRAYKACIENGLKGTAAWKGQHHTEETKKQVSEKNKKYWQGRPKPWLRKKININGTLYNGVAEVVKKYKVTRETVYNRIKNPDLNWNYVTTK